MENKNSTTRNEHLSAHLHQLKGGIYNMAKQKFEGQGVKGG
jgi:hypothetical protein